MNPSMRGSIGPLKRNIVQMKNIIRLSRNLFAIPWIIFGIQHFMYADFVTTLVPAYMPFKLFWVYFTGTAMIAAGISFIIDVKVRLSSTLLGVMLMLFVLQLHTAILASDLYNSLNWTRTLQDISLSGAAFALASGPSLAALDRRTSFILFGKIDLVTAARYLYAIPLVLLGLQHFFEVSFVTGKIPGYLPIKVFWDYLIGAVIIVTAVSMVINKKAALAAAVLGGVLLLLALLLHGPLLVTDCRNGLEWTTSMLDLAIAAGAFLVADCLPQTYERTQGQIAAQNIE